MSGGNRVAMAMSGGVDSSTAAAILKSQGYDVVGFSMQLWDQNRHVPEGPAARAGRCCSIEDLYDARGVASRLGFPYYVVNFQQEFEQKVVRYFIESYRAGETPSPCVLCNSHMKFGHLIRMADEVGAARVATGHYARVARDEAGGRWHLMKGRDADKDQSYFLFELRQEQLARAVFPLGELGKSDVRRIAREHGLEVADKPDSQEICFVPDRDYAGFVERHFEAVVGGAEGGAFPGGEVVNAEGRRLGSHGGIHRFTIGQRKGLGIAGPEPLYVIDLDPATRQVVVGNRTALGKSRCRLVRPNWISIPRPEAPIRVEARIRSRHREVPATATPLDDGSVEIEFDVPQLAVTPGQACVLYQGDRVAGGGWIARDSS